MISDRYLSKLEEAARRMDAIRADAKNWDESKHPRGQPENAGQFSEVSKGKNTSQEEKFNERITKEFSRYGVVPEEFESFPLFHGTNTAIKQGSMYPDENKPFIYLAEDSEEANQYGPTYEAHIKKGLKTAKLYNTFSSKNEALTAIKDKFGDRVEKIIKSGKLWRNKSTEKDVMNYLFNLGYEHIIFTDEVSEEGGETTSHIVKNPAKNIFIKYRR